MIAIVTALNDRRNVSGMVFKCAERLRRYADGFIDIRVYAACSSFDDMDFAMINNASWAGINENLTGLKFNTALKHAFEAGAEKVIVMGDDDAISTSYFSAAFSIANHHVGTNYNGYIDQKTGRCMTHRYEFKNKLIGAGRILSRECVESVAFRQPVEITREFKVMNETYQKGAQIWFECHVAEYFRGMNLVKYRGDREYIGLWPDRQMKSLDYHVENNLAMAGFTPKNIQWDDRVHVTDVKSYDQIKPQNIWPYSILEEKCRAATFDDVTWFMSDDEKHIAWEKYKS